MTLRIDPSDRIVGGATVAQGPGLKVEPRERPHFTQPKREFKIQLPLRAMAMGAGALVVIGLVIWFFTSKPSATEQAEAEVLVIRASTDPYKVRVDDQSVPSVRHQDKRVYDRLGKPVEAVQEEVLLPAPEAPIEVGSAPVQVEPEKQESIKTESLVDVMTPEKIVEKVAGSVPVSSKPLPAVTPEVKPTPQPLDAGVDEGEVEDVVAGHEMSMEDLINEGMKSESTSETAPEVDDMSQGALMKEVLEEEESLSEDDAGPVRKVFRSDGAVLNAKDTSPDKPVPADALDDGPVSDEDPLASLIGGMND